MRIVVIALLSACAGVRAPAVDVGIEQRPDAAATKQAESFEQLGSRDVLAAALRYPPTSDAREAPLDLTASDGTGLELRALEVDAVVEGPLAFTEMRLRFHNPEAREREGRFRVTLPPDAAVSRLAMRIDRRWQEAEVVERARARVVYEDFLHRKQDPALLEKSAGNEVSARVFPIAPNSDKELVVAYSQPVAGRYRLALRGLPEVDRLRVSARVLTESGGHRIHRMQSDGRRPEDFEVTVPDAVWSVSSKGSDGIERAVVRVRAPVLDTPLVGQRWAMLIDTSASRAPGFARYAERVHALVVAMSRLGGADAPLTVAAFDQRVVPLYKGTLGGMPTRVVEDLLARRPLGASNLEAAIRWLHEQRDSDRAVIVGDAVATAGKTDDGALLELGRALDDRYARIDVVLAGGIRGDALARRLAGEALDQPGMVVDLDGDIADAARRLCTAATSVRPISVEGASWWWPKKLDAVQAGDSALVVLERPTSESFITVSLRGKRIVTKPRPASLPLVDRALTLAKIEEIEHERITEKSAPVRESLRQRMVSLSRRGRVLSDHTAFLVLETEDDYRRFAIDRQATRDILTVGPRGLEVRQGEAPMVIAGGREVPSQSRASAGPPQPSAPARPEQGYAYEFSDDPLRPQVNFSVRNQRAGRPASGRPIAPQRRSLMMEELPSDAEAPGALPPRSKRVRAYTGRVAKVMTLLEEGANDAAIVEALRWRNQDAGDMMALVALGEALEARGQRQLAARAYGSIIDLFPDRADMRRFAGARLDRLGGSMLAIDTYRAAVADRPDHATGHRLLAYALLRNGIHDQAFGVLAKALTRTWPDNVARVLREDLGLVGAAWAALLPTKRAAIERRLKKRDITLPTTPSTRFVLSWETDANDVDLHIVDGNGDHAYYQDRTLPSGGSLYNDVTTGYGPECFTIDGRASAYPYEIAVHYYERGPMGYGLGKVEVIEHDGAGNLRFRHLPFVVMNDGAYVELGTLRGPLR